MKKKIAKYAQQYLPLFGVLLAGVIGFNVFSYDLGARMAVVIAMAVGYVSWGIVYHHTKGDLQIAIVAEYIIIAILGVTVVFSLLLRS
ncbi:MAG: hypothetical protein NZM26_03655 [Patescibacteria group bacterium]|nr:hypothetical protein [Patescibacteria group bacterium]